MRLEHGPEVFHPHLFHERAVRDCVELPAAELAGDARRAVLFLFARLDSGQAWQSVVMCRQGTEDWRSQGQRQGAKL